MANTIIAQSDTDDDDDVTGQDLFADVPDEEADLFGGGDDEPLVGGIEDDDPHAIPDEEDEPWPEPRFLRQGVRTKGFVLLDEVSLGYELWRQANGFPPIVSPAPANGENGSGTGAAGGST